MSNRGSLRENFVLGNNHFNRMIVGGKGNTFKELLYKADPYGNHLQMMICLQLRK
jgi:hypothetical protein